MFTPIERAACRLPKVAGALVVVLVVAGCGSSDSATTAKPAGPTQSLRAAALSLQQAMDATSRSIDGVRGTRDSLERLGSSLQPAVSQTSDVIGLLTPKATSAGTESMLLNAAREQRTFLQFAADSTRSRSRRAASSTLSRSREAGRRASDAYAQIAQQDTGLAGLLPASTTFNTGRLRDAVQAVTGVRKRAGSSSPSSGGSNSGGASSGGSSASSASCGDGLSVNSTTSCPFARNVKDAYEGSGGASTIDVYSPVTKETYSMSCTDGLPTVCRGGNSAVVYIR